MEPVEGSRALVVVVDGDAEVVIGHLDLGHPDLALVDALARLQLAARRLGCSLRLRHPGQELCELLDLVGLADVVAGRPGLPLEPGREAEGDEEPDVEEVVQPRDPAP